MAAYSVLFDDTFIAYRIIEHTEQFSIKVVNPTTTMQNGFASEQLSTHKTTPILIHNK